MAKLRLSPKLVDLAFRLFETPVEEMVYSKSRVIEYSFVLNKLLPRQPCRVLDVGCTYRFNYVAPTLASMGWEVHGIDVRQFRFKHRSFHFVMGDIRHTEFPDSFFDSIYCVSTIEHVGIRNAAYEITEQDPDGDRKAMNEMQRILKPGGSLLLTTEFGKPASTRLLRVYDSPLVRRLFSGWTAKELSFYAQDADGNWVSIPEAQASLKAGEPHALLVCELTSA